MLNIIEILGLVVIVLLAFSVFLKVREIISFYTSERSLSATAKENKSSFRSQQSGFTSYAHQPNKFSISAKIPKNTKTNLPLESQVRKLDGKNWFRTLVEEQMSNPKRPDIFAPAIESILFKDDQKMIGFENYKNFANREKRFASLSKSNKYQVHKILETLFQQRDLDRKNLKSLAIKILIDFDKFAKLDEDKDFDKFAKLDEDKDFDKFAKLDEDKDKEELKNI